MALTTKEKTKIIKEVGDEKNTGSSEVQIALLSKEIDKLVLHLKKHSQDVHSKKGLLTMVIKRKKLLSYLKKTSEKRYADIIKKIGLKARRKGATNERPRTMITTTNPARAHRPGPALCETLRPAYLGAATEDLTTVASNRILADLRRGQLERHHGRQLVARLLHGHADVAADSIQAVARQVFHARLHWRPYCGPPALPATDSTGMNM